MLCQILFQRISDDLLDFFFGFRRRDSQLLVLLVCDIDCLHEIYITLLHRKAQVFSLAIFYPTLWGSGEVTFDGCTFRRSCGKNRGTC